MMKYVRQTSFLNSENYDYIELYMTLLREWYQIWIKPTRLKNGPYIFSQLLYTDFGMFSLWVSLL